MGSLCTTILATATSGERGRGVGARPRARRLREHLRHRDSQAPFGGSAEQVSPRENPADDGVILIHKCWLLIRVDRSQRALSAMAGVFV